MAGGFAVIASASFYKSLLAPFSRSLSLKFQYALVRTSAMPRIAAASLLGFAFLNSHLLMKQHRDQS